MQKKTFILSLIIIILVCFGVYEYAFAASANYVPLAPIPGLTGGTTLGTNATQSSPGLSAYLAQLYTWSVAAASGLAVVMIMWGGVEYMTSAGGGGVEEAKKRISASIMGLLLALGSYIILSTVNKDLLKLNFNLGTLSVAQDEFKTYNSNFVDTGENPNVRKVAGGSSGGTSVAGSMSTSGIGKTLSEAWGDEGATEMEGLSIDGRQTYYASGEKISDSNTNAGRSAFGTLIEGTEDTVGSAASIFYPPGTLVQIRGIKYIIDDNNLTGNSKIGYSPANQNLTNNATVDIYTTNINKANNTDTHNSMQVLYVPDKSTSMSASTINNIRNNPQNYIGQ